MYFSTGLLWKLNRKWYTWMVLMVYYCLHLLTGWWSQKRLSSRTYVDKASLCSRGRYSKVKWWRKFRWKQWQSWSCTGSANCGNECNNAKCCSSCWLASSKHNYKHPLLCTQLLLGILFLLPNCPVLLSFLVV